jgi:hypothetical protein
MKEERGPWYLLTGLLIGAVLGLAYAWFYAPVHYVDASPASLSESYRDHYRVLISAAFLANGDLPRARARLGLLGDPDPARLLAIQAQRALAEKQPEQVINALGLLAVSLSEGDLPAVALPATPTPMPAITQAVALPPTTQHSPPPETVPAATASTTDATTVPTEATTVPTEAVTVPTEAATPTSRPPSPTPTLLPTRTATATQGAPFVLRDKSPLCDIKLREPRIIIHTLDAAGQPVPGVEIIVSWPGGEDRLFTGLKPELGLGYGDFNMLPGTSYSVHLAEGGELVQGLLSNECETRAGERFWGSWALMFAQP